MTPSNHSDEVPYTPTTVIVNEVWTQHRRSTGSLFREADKEFDRWLATHDAALVAATHARQYAATREQLAKALHKLDGGEAETWDMGEWIHAHWLTKADALLATPGPLLDAAEVRREVVDWMHEDGSADDYTMARVISHFGLAPTLNDYREARP